VAEGASLFRPTDWLCRCGARWLGIRDSEQKFFASFFQKKEDSFFLIDDYEK